MVRIVPEGGIPNCETAADDGAAGAEAGDLFAIEEGAADAGADEDNPMTVAEKEAGADEPFEEPALVVVGLVEEVDDPD